MLSCFFGHNFKPRYSQKIPPGFRITGAKAGADAVAKQIEAAKVQVYEGDVCTYCGSVVNKPWKNPVSELLQWPDPGE